MSAKLTYKAVRKAVAKGINANPQSIKIYQKGKVLINGSFKNIDKEYIVTGVVYVSKTNEIKVDTDVRGTSNINKNYEMVIDNTIEIESDSRCLTTIECVEGKFKVTYVNIYAVEGKIAGYECGLERLD